MRASTRPVPVALLLLCIDAADAQERNVALGRPYSLVPSPSYRLCKDAGDLAQLTDGEHTRPDKQLWIQPGAVGWKLPVDGDAEAVIDLGRQCPIDSVRVTTGSAPQAEAYLPSVLVAVSDDGQAFRVVGRVDTRRRHQAFRTMLRADELRTRGRYVLVRLQAFGVYAFCDEIEVLEGSHGVEEVRLSDEPVAPLRTEPEPTALQARLLRDLELAAARLKVGRVVAPNVLARIQTARREIEATDKTDVDTVSVLEAKVRGVQRQVAQALFAEPELAVWCIEPWEDISPGDVPVPGVPDTSVLHVVAGQNECESSALMLTNLSAKRCSVHVELRDEVRWGGWAKLRHAVFVRTRGGGLVADALPLLEGGRLDIPPWESRQVWLQTHTGGAEPGQHGSKLTVTHSGGRKEVQFTVDVPLYAFLMSCP